jgi:hypothetical protein
MPSDTVILNNPFWNRVKVEARRGNNSIPENNASLGSRVLSRGSNWIIPSDAEDVYFRREAQPDLADGVMVAAWTRMPCFGKGETFQVNL